MVKVSVLYPNEPGRKFDMDYYLRVHIPLVQQKLGAACKSIAVAEGVAGAEPGSAPAYATMCHMYFDTEAAFRAAFTPVADILVGDIPNYTDIRPTFQVSNIKL